MNFGVLPETLNAEFKVNPDPLGDRELMKSETRRIPDINWIRGFIEGEGCFYINIYKRKDTSLGLGVKLVFKVTQDSRNQGVLELLCAALDCGKLYNQSSKSKVQDIMVTGIGDILGKIIPFFENNPLLGAKLQDFHDFVKVAKMMENKLHHTREGIEAIRSIKDGMNSKRTHDS
uniref:LAGLIDADG endonuclease n=1 Tax=Ophiognomonia clavigignenti-juglandacearum TaxID=218668 RepID=A0A291LJ34_9PEZI|nr:LAGLIDADG endonuclease [Ophiognomonia clavigignenti-juglandacearum]